MLSPDGALVFSDVEPAQAFFDAHTGEPVSPAVDAVHPVAVTADDARFVARTHGDLLGVFEMATGELVEELAGPALPWSYPFQLAVSEDGRTVAASLTADVVRVWRRAAAPCEAR